MGGFFGAISKNDCVYDVFFGVDYHSHLGTRYGGMTVYSKEDGFQRQIHGIENTPFRSKFENDIAKFHGTAAIGCIADTDPEPLMVRSHLGLYAIAFVGIIKNSETLVEQLSTSRKQQFMAMSSGKVNSAELAATLINEKDSFAEGIKYAQELIEGSATILILTEKSIIAARDRVGRLPVHIGKNDDGYSVSFESFAYQKLGYHDEMELGPGEIVEITESSITRLAPPSDKMKICAFLWSYYGYPNSTYENSNVEVMRYKNGEIMARNEIESGSMPDVDLVAGVPDSGIPHAIGYANYSKKQYARPFIKYTPTWPRSFLSGNQNVRARVATMKQIPVPELIKDKKLMFVDDSIVRGTQIRGTVDFLFENGAKEVHIRSACPPIMYSCKYLNFSQSRSDMELLTRSVINEIEGDEGEDHLEEYRDQSTERGKCMIKKICETFGIDSLSYQSLEGVLEAIGVDKDKVCTYCWTGEE